MGVLQIIAVLLIGKHIQSGRKVLRVYKFSKWFFKLCELSHIVHLTFYFPKRIFIYWIFFSIHRFRHHKRTNIPRVNKILPIIIKDKFDMIIENLHSLTNK